MKFSCLIIGLICFQLAYSQSVEGIYVGYEELCFEDSMGNKNCELDASMPGYLWYHQTTYKLINDSVFVDRNPVLINGTDTVYSSSDGAFIYERGRYSMEDSLLDLLVNFYYCDYCATQVDSLGNSQLPPTRLLKATLHSEGFMIDGVLYSRQNKKDYVLRSEGPSPLSLMLQIDFEKSDRIKK